jgi:hypothetical protein
MSAERQVPEQPHALLQHRPEQVRVPLCSREDGEGGQQDSFVVLRPVLAPWRLTFLVALWRRLSLLPRRFKLFPAQVRVVEPQGPPRHAGSLEAHVIPTPPRAQ